MEKSTQEEWLKTHYNESPSEGPPAKRVKFEDVYTTTSALLFHEQNSIFKWYPIVSSLLSLILFQNVSEKATRYI